MQFVVQEALLINSSPLYLSSLTPSKNVPTFPPPCPSVALAEEGFAGALKTTFFAPASRCQRIPSSSANLPVDSITTSTPSSFQGSSAGSFVAYVGISTPSTEIFPTCLPASAVFMSSTKFSPDTFLLQIP